MTSDLVTGPALRTPRRRSRLRRVLAVFVVLLLAAAAVVVIWFVPDYRTAFVVDTSVAPAGADPQAIGRAVGSAAGNAGSRDALSLRQFGGGCGDSANTSEIVSSGRRNGQRVRDAAGGLRQAGSPTLHSGVLAAVDDFSGLYPFRGWRVNRIVVVTSHGLDACVADQEAAMRSIRERASAAGLELEIRFVGYQVPEAEKEPLSQLASAAGAPAPSFANTVPELDIALREVTTPDAPEATEVDVPITTTTTEAPPPQPALIAVVVSNWLTFTTTVTALDAAPCTVEGISTCQFLVPSGGTVTLQAEISGFDAMTEAPFDGGPLWFGCDEGAQATTECTLTLDTGRLVYMGNTGDYEAALAGCPFWTPEAPRIDIPLGTKEFEFPR
jgi:hypothetical protein